MNTMSNETEMLAQLVQEVRISQRENSERMQQAALALERIAERIDVHGAKMDKLDSAVFSTNQDQPGLVTRVDRMEQRFLATEKVRNWLLGGGLFAFITGAYGVYQLLKH